MKNIWDTTLAQYRILLNNWFKGTGGGSGLETMFESWSDEQFEKFGINRDEYDHTNIATRNPIFASLYDDNNSPFLTFIFMHDSANGHMLSSKYQPLASDQGEFGLKSKQSDGTGKKEKATNKILAGLDSMVTTITKIMDLDGKKMKRFLSLLIVMKLLTRKKLKIYL